jgi:FAD/FMN-containing dehydrogenase
VTTPPWSSLDAAIAGEVVLPGAREYDTLRRGYNARFHDRRPTAIVRCATRDDVVQTVRVAREHGLELVARSGGHCLGGRSSTMAVLVDVGRLDDVVVTGGRAAIGAGARLGDVYEVLDRYQATLPAGSCPDVGIAGLALGGGLGVLGRLYGVTSDHLVAAEVVLADGRVVHADAGHYGDLFWALRGAGGNNFGIVTRLMFQTVPATDATNVHAAWSASSAVEVVDAWQRWAPFAPDELAASLKVTVGGERDHPVAVNLYATMTGHVSDAVSLLQEFVDRVAVEPARFTATPGTPADTRFFWAHLDEIGSDDRPPSAGEQHSPLLVHRSEFFAEALPRDAIRHLLRRLTRGRHPDETRELDFMPWGGAYNRVPADASAFVHRREHFLLKHATATTPRHLGTARTWVEQSWAGVHPWGSGRVFQNFADPDLTGWDDAYYGTNVQRLLATKARYDPDNVFSGPQSLRA